MNKIDLHMHSTYSDGKFSPRELIDIAIKKDIPIIAITDHDNSNGVIEAIEYSKNKEIRIIPGIEITSTPPKEVKELHIGGLFIDPENPEILDIPKRHKIYSVNTSKKIIKNLNILGYKIKFRELWEKTEGKHFGRNTIAEILMEKYPERLKDRKQVFNELLGKQGKAFVMPKGTSMKKCIEIIHNAGGIAIIAHPWYLGENMDSLIKKFAKLGGDGIEVDCTIKEGIPEDMQKNLREKAKKLNLIVSGGTDFHMIKEGEKEIGDRGISIEEFNEMEKYLKSKNKLFLF